MRSSKSRSRGNKNRNNRPTGGNVINRVFDSSGPDGKVRGTPQQIIEKYLQLHRDAQLAGDRVNAENFAQHAEHYTRILAEAQREVDRLREEQEQFNRERQAERDRERAQRNRGNDYAADPASMEQPDIDMPLGEELLVDVAETVDAPLVDIPEGKPSFLGNRGERRPQRDRQDRRNADRPARGERTERAADPVEVEAKEPESSRISGFADSEQPAFLSAPAAKEAEAASEDTTGKAEAAPKRTPRPRKPRAPKAAPEAAE